MRRFYLRRKEDESGVSGVGVVAEGIEFSDGTCSMRWKTKIASTGFYNTLDELEHIHGHNGKTEIEWIDNWKSQQELFKL